MFVECVCVCVECVCVEVVCDDSVCMLCDVVCVFVGIFVLG